MSPWGAFRPPSPNRHLSPNDVRQGSHSTLRTGSGDPASHHSSYNYRMDALSSGQTPPANGYRQVTTGSLNSMPSVPGLLMPRQNGAYQRSSSMLSGMPDSPGRQVSRQPTNNSRQNTALDPDYPMPPTSPLGHARGMQLYLDHDFDTDRFIQAGARYASQNSRTSGASAGHSVGSPDLDADRPRKRVSMLEPPPPLESSRPSFKVPEDIDSYEPKALIGKVLEGIQTVIEHQNRLEDLVLASSAHQHHHRPRESSFHHTSGSLANAKPMSLYSPAVRSSVDLRAQFAQGTGRFTQMVGAVTQEFFDVDMVKQTSNGSGTMRWPATLPARHEVPAELAAEDDKLVSAIAKMGLGTNRFSPYVRQSSANRARRHLRGVRRAFGLPVVHPNTTRILCFDLLGCSVLLHDVCVTPYILAWRADVEGWWLLTAYLAALFWIWDTCVGLCMAFYKDGELIQTQPEVALHFLRYQFPIDLCLILVDGLNLFLDTAQQVGWSLVDGGNVRLFRSFKLTRLLKLARAARVIRVIDRMWVSGSDAPASSSTFVAVLVVKILIVTIISNHILACLWFWQGAHGPSDTLQTWIEEADLLHSSHVYQYFTSLHWSVGQMTLGSSDVMPVNSYERFLTIVFLVNGLVFGSTTISYVSAAIVGYIMAKRDVTNQLLECRRFLRQYQCPQKLAAQVIQQVSKRLSEEVPLKEVDVVALQVLAPTLRIQVQHATRIPHLEKHALFHIWGEIEPRSLHALSIMAVSHTFMSRDDDLFHAGQPCDQAWFVIRGRLRYFQSPGSSKVVDETETMVYQSEWVAEVALWAFWFHVGSVEACDKTCHLLCINANGLLQMLQDFPTLQRLAQQYAKNFHACLTSAGPPHSPWPSDVHVPFTEDVAMLLSQHVGVGLLKRGLALGKLNLSDDDEAYLVKELMAGKCTLQYADDGSQLERVVGVANVMLKWEDSFSGLGSNLPSHPSSSHAPSTLDSLQKSGQCQVLYQIGVIDEKGNNKLSLHMPGTKRWTGESPQVALQRILDSDLKPFAKHMIIEDSERRVTVKEGTQTLKMRTKTVKTIYRSMLQKWPSNIRTSKVNFPKLPGLEDLTGHDILALPQHNKVLLYSFLLPEQYDVLDSNDNMDSMKEWIRSVIIDYCVL